MTIIELILFAIVIALPFIWESYALDTQKNSMPRIWFKNEIDYKGSNMICKGQLSDVQFTDIQKTWPLA